MSDVTANLWTGPTAAAETTRPAPAPRRTQPLLMGDILTARNEVPELLLRWRAEERARDAD